MEYVLKNKRNYEGTQTIDLVFKDKIKVKQSFKMQHVNFNIGLIDQV